jgi:hypothetical protein
MINGLRAMMSGSAEYGQQKAASGDIDVMRYIDKSQHGFIRYRNFASQDPWLVSAGLQAAADAAPYKTLILPSKSLFAVAYPWRVRANTTVRNLGRGAQGPIIKAKTTGIAWPQNRGVVESFNYQERNGGTTGTWSRSGSTVTVAAGGHGLTNGQTYWADTWTGLSNEFADGAYTVTVVDAGHFSITTAGSGAGTGTLKFYGAGATGADYWHYGMLDGVWVEIEDRTSVNAPDYGIVIAATGEMAGARLAHADIGKVSGWLFVGAHATLTMENCHHGDGDGDDVSAAIFRGHPEATYPTTGVFQRTHSSGSAKFFGWSGDYCGDPSVGTYATTSKGGGIVVCGSQVITVCGMKSEYNFPAIRVTGTNVAAGRARITVVGLKSEQSGGAKKDVVVIADGAKPEVSIVGMQCSNSTNVIRDYVLGADIQVADGTEGYPIIYCPEYELRYHVANVYAGQNLYVKAVPGASDQNSTLFLQHNNQANYAFKMDVRYTSPDDFFRMMVGSGGNTVLSVDNGLGQGLAIWTYNGSAMIRHTCIN